ncbi:MAG TPA: hypothetical protein VGC18_04995 [Lacisediminihabitans sp.]|uniref:COG4315 family predicted lipoprotein n=1 Tax=Lacisediminihabitans sp. TaxID=2787631 RepID=UPI002EDA3FF6
MKTTTALTLAGAALAIVTLAGCASMAASGSGSTGSAPSSSSSSTAVSGDAGVAKTSLGTIVVDGKGMTAYFFDKDTANSGMSACTGQCESLWPAITSSSTTPTVSGISGTVGTITGVAGGNQITIDGRPIYTFSGDKAAGDVNGQGLMGIWWAVSPSGSKITTAPTSSTGGSTGGY